MTLTPPLTKDVDNTKALRISMKNEKKNKFAVALGRLGGKARSKRKAMSCKKNGKLGGRPKKHG